MDNSKVKALVLDWYKNTDWALDAKFIEIEGNDYIIYQDMNDKQGVLSVRSIEYGVKYWLDHCLYAKKTGNIYLDNDILVFVTYLHNKKELFKW